MLKNVRSRVVIVSFAAVLAVSAAIGSGILDRFASDRTIDKTAAIGSLAVYWLSFFIVAWLIPAAVRRRKEAILSIVSIAAALIVVELGCRIFLPGTTAVRLGFAGLRSRQFHHVYPAHARLYMGRFEGIDVFVDTNEDGLRAPYSREDFKKYPNRVIVLGDSFAFGLGVRSEDAFPARLENELRRGMRGDGVAVLNTGIVSYSPFLQKPLFAKTLAAYRPTLVLVFLDASDIADDYAYMKEAERSDGLSTFAGEDGTPAKYRGALYELTRPYHRQLTSFVRYPFQLAEKLSGLGGQNLNPGGYDYYEFSVMVGDTLETNRFFIYRHPLKETREFFDRTMNNIDEIASLATRIGADFALVVTPRFHHWNDKECPDNWEKNQYGLNEPYQYEYFRYFEEAGRAYAIINLLPDFQATDRYPLVFRNDPHWNAAGHAFAADAVARHLLTRQLIRSTRSPTRPS
jgi:hypothetical protein